MCGLNPAAFGPESKFRQASLHALLQPIQAFHIAPDSDPQHPRRVPIGEHARVAEREIERPRFGGGGIHGGLYFGDKLDAHVTQELERQVDARAT